MKRSELIQWLEHYEEEIVREAARLWEIPMPVLTEELFSLYETEGNRLKYETVYFTRRKYLAVFGLNAILNKKEQNIKKIEEILVEICEEECWALPAHVDREKDTNWKLCIDLFASETAQAVTEIASVLNDCLARSVITKVKQEVFRRVIDPYYSSTPPYGQWENSKFNWNPVCAGAIGSASIYLMGEEQDKLEVCLNRVCDSISHYMDGFEADGTCMEGLSYFTYGMTYFTGFADQLYNDTQRKENLLANEKCRKVAEFQQKAYFESGRTVCFSDGDSNDHFRMGLTLYLSMQFPSVQVPPLKKAATLHSDSCYRFMALYRDLIWTKRYLNCGFQNDSVEEKKCRHTILPHAQWSICESKNQVGMAIKGGHNNEPHNHNDVGSFFYLIGNEMILTDLGAGEYTKQYFSSDRYKILCNSSYGHNIPTINKMPQQSGSVYRCDKFEADSKGKTRISFGAAYEDGIIESIVREASFCLDSGVLKIEDHFSPSILTKSVEERIITEWEPEHKKGEILIQAKQAACKIIIEDENADIQCHVIAHNDHVGNIVSVYVLEWSVNIENTRKSSYTIIPMKTNL
ncbi:MAG: heparinase [Lachnospiraceae bacterium]